MPLSSLERKILNCLQADIPLERQPFKILSKQLGLKEEELLRRIKQLKDKGIIRNFTAHLDHRKLGFQSSLIALKVPFPKLESIVSKITVYPEVTHCYLRKGEYNLWVVFVCLGQEKLRKFLNNLAREIDKENILNLPTKKQFKLNTTIRI